MEKQLQEEVELTDADIEEIPELSEEDFEMEEDKISLENLVKEGDEKIKEAGKAAKEIEKKGEARVETVAGNIGISKEDMSQVKENMGFGERKLGIIKKIKALTAITKEKIKALFGEKEEIDLGEEDIEEIKEKAPFDPAEEYRKVQKVVESNIGTAEKEKVLREYKKELMKQKEGMARIQEDFRKTVERNPDISAEDLMQRMEPYGVSSRLTEKQREFFKELTEKYQEKHNEIEKVREQYPDDKELFKACFGFEPMGKVRVEKGPMSFYFKISNPDDFVDIYENATRELLKEELSEEVKQTIKTRYGGSLLPKFSKIEDLSGLLMIENTKVEGANSKETKKHENQHLFYNFFKKIEAEKNIREVPSEKNWEQKEDDVLSYFRFLREDFIDRKTKDEILAYSLNKKGAVDDPYRALTEEDSPYNIIRGMSKVLKEEIEKYDLKKNIGDKKLVEMINKVFKEEYTKIVQKGFESIERLKKMNMDERRIVELLTPEPLERWPNVVRHLKQIKAGR